MNSQRHDKKFIMSLSVHFYSNQKMSDSRKMTSYTFYTMKNVPLNRSISSPIIDQFSKFFHCHTFDNLYFTS